MRASRLSFSQDEEGIPGRGVVMPKKALQVLEALWQKLARSAWCMPAEARLQQMR